MGVVDEGATGSVFSLLPCAATRPSMAGMSSDAHYRAPGWFTRDVFNRIVAGATRVGISVWGSRILEVRGRKSGVPRRTPVNLLSVGGVRYLVAPRGQTQWVRNLRAAGDGDLLLGRRREHFHATEVVDSDKEEVLRAYLRRWTWEVGQFFSGVAPRARAQRSRSHSARAPDLPDRRLTRRDLLGCHPGRRLLVVNQSPRISTCRGAGVACT